MRKTTALLDDLVEANGILNCVAVVPPLLLIVHESLPLHYALQKLPIPENDAARVFGMRGAREIVEGRAHGDLTFRRQVYQGQVDGNAKIVA